MKSLRVMELDEFKVARLLGSHPFDSLHPKNCRVCGGGGPFRRRVFRVFGVPRAKQADDEVQGLLEYHFRDRHGIEFVFFKVHERAFYADSAVCPKCGSTEVVFDINLPQEWFTRMKHFLARRRAMWRSSSIK